MKSALWASPGWDGCGPAAQSLDVETSVRYLFIFSNTKDDGPVVLDVPPAVAWAKFFGTILDAWRAKVGHPRVTGGREELALRLSTLKGYFCANLVGTLVR